MKILKVPPDAFAWTPLERPIEPRWSAQYVGTDRASSSFLRSVDEN